MCEIGGVSPPLGEIPSPEGPFYIHSVGLSRNNSDTCLWYRHTLIETFVSGVRCALFSLINLFSITDLAPVLRRDNMVSRC